MHARVEETTPAPPATTAAAGSRTLARLLPPPRPSVDKDVLAFRTSLFAPLRNFEPSSGKGRFDALLLPGPGVLQITVRVRFHLISGRQKSDDDYPGMRGADPSEFVWTPAEEQKYRTRFLTEIAPQWSGKFSFVSTRTPQSAWQDVTVTPIVQIVEDDTAPHVVLDVHRRPDDAEAVTNFIRSRDPSKPGQPLESYLTSDNLRLEAELDDPIADESVPVTKVHFKRGHTDLDERGQGELAPIISQMAADPKSHATLRGHASSDRKAGTTVQEGFKLNLRLSRERSQAVADALEAAGIAPERIMIRNWGDAGATFDEDNCRVDVAVGSHQGHQGAAHEFGHILGLGDEYGYDDIPGARPGDPLKDPEYAQMVKAQTGIDLVRTSDESMMSKGGTIRPWHYSPFLEALKRIAGPSWKLR